MENFLSQLTTQIPPIINHFFGLVMSSWYAGRVVWIMFGMIFFDYIIKITFQLMGRNVH